MIVRHISNFEELIRSASTLRRMTLAIVNPANDETFAAVRDCTARLNVNCILVGDEAAIRSGISTGDGLHIIHASGIDDALQLAIALAREGKADILMKGSIDTSTMMRAVLKEESGLRTDRLMSDIFVLEYPAREENKFVMITDGGMTLAPDLKNKVDLIKNAVEVAHALGNPMPKVAVLSATEFVLPALPSTLDAAALAKMNERGQIQGCIVDGPLALDNALSPEAAAEKGIVSPVAGHAEILVAANIESANSLAKSTTYFANLPLAHVIVGARVPVLIPSRADKSQARLLSVALGLIVSDYHAHEHGD